jgi:glutathione S-transferase
MGRTGFPPAQITQAEDRLRRGVQRMAETIRRHGGPWLLDDLTLADIAVMPVLIRMEDIGMAHFWQDLPEVQHWLAAMKRQPAFAPTYGAGALLSQKYPDLGLPGIARAG